MSVKIKSYLFVYLDVSDVSMTLHVLEFVLFKCPSIFFCHEVMLPEVMQVLRGAGKVGSALVTTQGEQLRLMACTSSIGAGLKAAQDAVNGLVGTLTGSSKVTLFSRGFILLSMIWHNKGCSRIRDNFLMTAHTEQACFPLLRPQEQSVKEDVFPDAEGWETVDPEEAAKWSVGSEFAHDSLEQSQTEGGL